MKNKVLKNIQYCLNNDNGAPHIETLGIAALSLAVGVGLFVFGRHVSHWLENKPEPTIEGTQIPADSTWNW